MSPTNGHEKQKPTQLVDRNPPGNPPITAYLYSETSATVIAGSEKHNR